MKISIIATVVSCALGLTTVNALAQVESAPAQNTTPSALSTVLSNATADSDPAQLQAELAAAIAQTCSDCTEAEVQAMMAEATATLGADSPVMQIVLNAMADSGISADTITLAAVSLGVDATAVSQATAAGPATPLADGVAQAPQQPNFNQPAQPATGGIPAPAVAVQGAGGTGGDSGISEVVTGG